MDQNNRPPLRLFIFFLKKIKSQKNLLTAFLFFLRFRSFYSNMGYWSQYRKGNEEEEEEKDKKPDEKKKEKKKKLPPEKKKKNVVHKKRPVPNNQNQNIISKDQVNELLSIKKKFKSEEEIESTPTLDIQTGASFTSKKEKENEFFRRLFGADPSEFNGNFLFRGKPTSYITQTESKKKKDLEESLTRRMEERTKKGSDFQTEFSSNENIKRIMKNTDLNKFQNMTYENDEDSWNLSQNVLVNGLDTKEEMVVDTFLRGEAQLRKKLSRDPKNLRVYPDIPILGHSYFEDFMRPARGLPFGERQCANKEKCFAYLKTLKLNNNTRGPNEASSRTNAWIAREFLLPKQVKYFKDNPKELANSEPRDCIFCNRIRTEKRYQLFKESPRDISDVSKYHPCAYIKSEDPDEGIFIIQDHIVKIRDYNNNSNNDPENLADSYAKDEKIILPDPSNGIIGPFRRLVIEELHPGIIKLPTDKNGSISDIPIFKESNFFSQAPITF